MFISVLWDLLLIETLLWMTSYFPFLPFVWPSWVQWQSHQGTCKRKKLEEHTGTCVPSAKSNWIFRARVFQPCFSCMCIVPRDNWSCICRNISEWKVHPCGWTALWEGRKTFHCPNHQRICHSSYWGGANCELKYPKKLLIVITVVQGQMQLWLEKADKTGEKEEMVKAEASLLYLG